MSPSRAAMKAAVKIEANLHRSELEFARIIDHETGLPALVEALREGCDHHHMPLVNGWAHRTNRGKTFRCQLSEKARAALAQAGGADE